MIARLQALPELGRPERDQLELLRTGRAQAFALMERLNPDQAWFWTEEWQAKEREADADEAAGRTTFHASDEEFDAALDAGQVSWSRRLTYERGSASGRQCAREPCLSLCHRAPRQPCAGRLGPAAR